MLGLQRCATLPGLYKWQMLGLKPGVLCMLGKALCPLSCILSHLELLIPLPPFLYLQLPMAGITGETPFHFSFCLPSFSSVLSFPFEPGPCQVAPDWPRMQNLPLVSSQILGLQLPLCPTLGGMFILMNFYLISFRTLSWEASRMSLSPSH